MAVGDYYKDPEDGKITLVKLLRLDAWYIVAVSQEA